MADDQKNYGVRIQVDVLDRDGDEITTNVHTIRKLDYLNLCAVEDAAVGILETLVGMGYLKAIHYKGHTLEEVEGVKKAVAEAKQNR